MFYNSNNKTLADLYPHGAASKSCEVCDYLYGSQVPFDKVKSALTPVTVKTNFIHLKKKRLFSTLISVCEHHRHEQTLIEEYTGQIFGGYDGWSGHNWVYQPAHLGEAIRLVLEEPCCVPQEEDWKPTSRIEDQADLDFFLP